MRLNKHRNQAETGFNMTPMIDIVFLLIIFFMTVSQITRVVDHPVELPKIEQGGQATEPIAMTINVDRAGTMIVAEQQFDMAQLLVFVGQRLNQVNNNPDQLKIRIRGDRQCQMEHINALIHELESLDIRQIRIAIQGRN